MLLQPRVDDAETASAKKFVDDESSSSPSKEEDSTDESLGDWKRNKERLNELEDDVMRVDAVGVNIVQVDAAGLAIVAADVVIEKAPITKDLDFNAGENHSKESTPFSMDMKTVTTTTSPSTTNTTTTLTTTTKTATTAASVPLYKQTRFLIFLPHAILHFGGMTACVVYHPSLALRRGLDTDSVRS